MPFGGSDGQYYDDHLDYLLNASMPAQPLPEGIKKVIVTKPDTRDDNVYEPPETTDQNVLTPKGLEGNLQFQQDPSLETPVSATTTASTMPPQGSTEPAGALKSTGGTETPEIRPEPYGLNPPEQGPGFPRPPRGEPKVLYRTKTGIEFTDHDIEDAIGIALSAGPGAINKVGVLETIAKKIKPTELPPWAPEMPKPKVDPFEQVPFGYSEGEWAQMSPYQKKKVLENPPKFEDIPGTPEFEKKYGYNPNTISEKFSYGGINLDTTKLSIKQLSDLTRTVEDFSAGNLSGGEFRNELKEYKKYIDAGGFKGKAEKTTETVMADIKKILDEMEADPTSALNLKNIKKVPITESGNTMDAYIDMFVKQPKFDKIEKLPPKEAFKRGVEQALQGFKTSAAEAKNKMLNALRGPIGDLVQGPKIAPKGEYTEPAYRGLVIHQGGEPSSVFKYEKSGSLYSSANPMLADMYAGYLDAHPGLHVPEGKFPSNAQVMPLMINTKDYHYFDAKGEIWQKANKKAIEEAYELKKKGVVVDNVWDEPNSTTALGKPNKVYITFPQGAGTVKSRFAKKFDPSSPDMMYGIGAIGIGTAATGFISTENPE